jgi:peptidyl-prolyl cis-trans isomerase SurA
MRRVCALAAAGAAFMALSAAGAEPLTIDGIQAVVHDSVITSQDVRQMTAPAVRVLQRDYRGQDEVIRKKLAQAEQENLDQLVERQLILQDFKSSGYNLPESTLDDLVDDELRTQYKDRRTLAKSLQAQGSTFEKFRTKLREQYIVGAMRQKNISSEVIVSPHKMEQYYQAHKDDFKVDEEIKLRIIELRKPQYPDPRKTAEEILATIKQGATFEEMAATYSERTQQQKQGEWFAKPVLRVEFKDALKLKPGERTGIIETPDACYLLQVDDVRPEHVRPLSEVRGQIEKSFVTEERNRLEKQWVNRLKKKTFTRYFF